MGHGPVIGRMPDGIQWCASTTSQPELTAAPACYLITCCHGSSRRPPTASKLLGCTLSGVQRAASRRLHRGTWNGALIPLGRRI